MIVFIPTLRQTGRATDPWFDSAAFGIFATIIFATEMTEIF
jgi:hypothetical protein